MEFLPNVKYVAEAIRDCSGYMSGAQSIGCGGHVFKEGEAYELEIMCEPYILDSGEICLNFEARVLDGSLDGYDSPCGVEFYNIESFNRYFRIREAEME